MNQVKVKNVEVITYRHKLKIQAYLYIIHEMQHYRKYPWSAFYINLKQPC